MTQAHILSNHFIIVDVMFESDFTHTEGIVSMLPPIKTDVSRNLPLGCDAKTTKEGKKKQKKNCESLGCECQREVWAGAKLFITPEICMTASEVARRTESVVWWAVLGGGQRLRWNLLKMQKSVVQGGSGRTPVSKSERLSSSSSSSSSFISRYCS